MVSSSSLLDNLKWFTFVTSKDIIIPMITCSHRIVTIFSKGLQNNLLYQFLLIHICSSQSIISRFVVIGIGIVVDIWPKYNSYITIYEHSINGFFLFIIEEQSPRMSKPMCLCLSPIRSKFLISFHVNFNL